MLTTFSDCFSLIFTVYNRIAHHVRHTSVARVENERLAEILCDFSHQGVVLELERATRKLIGYKNDNILTTINQNTKYQLVNTDQQQGSV